MGATSQMNCSLKQDFEVDTCQFISQIPKIDASKRLYPHSKLKYYKMFADDGENYVITAYFINPTECTACLSAIILKFLMTSIFRKSLVIRKEICGIKKQKQNPNQSTKAIFQSNQLDRKEASTEFL